MFYYFLSLGNRPRLQLVLSLCKLPRYILSFYFIYSFTEIDTSGIDVCKEIFICWKQNIQSFQEFFMTKKNSYIFILM